MRSKLSQAVLLRMHALEICSSDLRDNASVGFRVVCMYVEWKEMLFNSSTHLVAPVKTFAFLFA